MTRYLLALLALTVTYALTLASFDPWDLAIGALLGSVVLALFGDLVFSRFRGGCATPMLPRFRSGGGSSGSSLSRRR
jgi:hypothetical protein